MNRRSGRNVVPGMRWLATAIAASLTAFTLPSGAQPEEPPPTAGAPGAAPEPAEPQPGAPREAPDTWGSGRPRAAAPPPVDARLEPEPEASAPEAAEDVGPRAPERDGVMDSAIRYTLEGIEVRGNTKTRSRVVLRYVPFRVGELLDVDDPLVELTRYRLLGTGFFRDVQFSLKRGSRRGAVVLVIEVDERNTIVINDLWMGLSQDADTKGAERPLAAYAGLDVAETNLAGTGITLGTAVAFGLPQDQLALRVRFLDPAFLGGGWMTAGSLLFNDAKDFFGNDRVRYDDASQLTRVEDFAVVQYTRFGGSVGVGRDLSVPTQLWLHYRLESVDATTPRAASHVRGIDREPIDFDVLPGRSILSTLRGTLQHDTRDHPFLPTRGWFSTVTAEVSLTPAGSDYGYQRLDAGASRWWRLPWKHVVRLDTFAGAIHGDAPFFEKYYVNDFTDFRPARVLGLNFERRPPPNFLGTDIIEVRRGQYAAKVGGEYRVPLYRGSRSVYGIDFFTYFGLFGVADPRDVERPPRGYSGLARVPVDLTANLGFRMDTSAGGFVFAFSNVLGFIPVRSEDRPETGQ